MSQERPLHKCVEEISASYIRGVSMSGSFCLRHMSLTAYCRMAPALQEFSKHISLAAEGPSRHPVCTIGLLVSLHYTGSAAMDLAMVSRRQRLAEVDARYLAGNRSPSIDGQGRQRCRDRTPERQLTDDAPGRDRRIGDALLYEESGGECQFQYNAYKMSDGLGER